MTAMVSAHDLSIGWAGEDPLLEHVSFEVGGGEIFAILGGSGCGKSTLLRFLVGLERPVSGSVSLAGVENPVLDAERPTFGMMFQQGALFGSMTVGANIGLVLERWTDLPSSAVLAMVRAKLRLVGLEDAEHKLPSAISGGMRKRAAIARAMALEPSLLFLDEPSSGLDPVTSAGVDQLILTLRRALGLTVVLVTHELGSVFSIVDRCLMLDAATHGVLATGSPRDLAASPDAAVSAFFHPVAASA